ncbi:hypothetical protein SAMN04515671_3668 [Nakamurella panacisegetis]|uniref:THUMP-like domain-containing protein n=1 Tax=Nakamurella panacisegetis TaxID=1090615 RepID=A0A1H0RN17_9ACTN|nr:class I SAM-dependent methyltransferase [Nakamurella panacisegetis]SDP30902.1 hypothetical protein SAMN04515671_3668 [Nakamurella panacisegetis]
MSAGYRFSRSDLDYLTSAAGADALAGAADRPLTEASLLTDLTALRRLVGGAAAAVAETVRLRRRAADKLGPGASRWLFTDEALQQATPLPVAQHRARRLRGFPVHDLTCSIGSDLAALIPGCAPAIGSDLDPIRVRMAAHNLTVSGLGSPVLVADALARVDRGLLPYADPARREAGGRRITSVDTMPSVADLDRVHAARPPVLRLPPGIDYETLARPGEVEVVSLDGGAREAVLWPSELALVARRATMLTSDGGHVQVTSDDPDDIPAGPAPDALVGSWIVDPDAAVVRAHLVRHYAARHGLTQLDPHLAYLSGPAVPAGVRGFQVLDAAPYTVATVGGWIRRDGTGTLEIKQRGTPVIPDELRKRLRPTMTRATTVAHTLVIARIGDRAWAFWCRARVGTAPVGPVG